MKGKQDTDLMVFVKEKIRIQNDLIAQVICNPMWFILPSRSAHNIIFFNFVIISSIQIIQTNNMRQRSTSSYSHIISYESYSYASYLTALSHKPTPMQILILIFRFIPISYHVRNYSCLQFNQLCLLQWSTEALALASIRAEDRPSDSASVSAKWQNRPKNWPRIKNQNFSL